MLQKPAGAWCRHSCAGGCAIHGPQQPEICRQYDCYWRDHVELPEQYRPDRIGVVVTEAGTVMIVAGKKAPRGYPVPICWNGPKGAAHKRGLSPFFLPVVTFQEDFAGAAQGPQAAAMLAHFVQQGFAVLVIHGLESRVEFDGARYPGVSAEAIEAALRYELSQDAGELRRLGAVDEDYRPLTFDEAMAACRSERAA